MQQHVISKSADLKDVQAERREVVCADDHAACIERSDRIVGSAVRLHPKSASLQASLGDAQRSFGDLPKTIAAYRKAVDLNPGWAPVYLSNLTEDIPGYIEAPANALTYAWTHFIGGHLGRLGDWAEMAAAEGLVSVHFVNAAGSLLVAPFGVRVAHAMSKRALEMAFGCYLFVVGGRFVISLL